MSLPAPVRAHRARPVRWLVVGLALTAVLFLFDVRGAYDDRVWGNAALDVDGVVGDDYRGRRQVPVTYHHPITDQRVSTSTYVWDSSRLPSAGQRVALEVDPDDPDAVGLAGDRFPVTGNLGGYAPLVVVPLLFCVARWWTVRRVARLASSDRTTFAMLGAIAPARGLRRRPVLHLYPLDAVSASASVCAVRLVTTGGCPVAGAVFPVEVKGIPRPLGRVAIRAAETVLWPTGRSLIVDSWPRPGRILEPSPPPPVDRYVLPTWVRSADPPPQRPGLRAGTGVWLLALAAAAVVGVVVTAATVAGAADERQLEAQRVTVVGEVVDRDTGDYTVTLTYRAPGNPSEQTTTFGVEFAEDYTVGRRYPVRLDPDSPGNARFALDPYDPIEPVIWGWIPTVAVALLLGRRALVRRSTMTIARSGPWFQLDAWAGVGGTVLLGDRALGYVRCTLALVGGVFRSLVGRSRDRVPTLAAPRRSTVPGDGPVLVAGVPEPGRPVALIDDGGAIIAASRRAGVPRSVVRIGRAAPLDEVPSPTKVSERGGFPRFRSGWVDAIEDEPGSGTTIRSGWVWLNCGMLLGAAAGSLGVIAGAVSVWLGIGVGIIGAIGAVVLLARVRLTVDHEGVSVCNGIGTRRLAWSAVERVRESFAPGSLRTAGCIEIWPKGGGKRLVPAATLRATERGLGRPLEAIRLYANGRTRIQQTTSGDEW